MQANSLLDLVRMSDRLKRNQGALSLRLAVCCLKIAGNKVMVEREGFRTLDTGVSPYNGLAILFPDTAL
jgi:hypothetical protein